jgi:hypothetical protein
MRNITIPEQSWTVKDADKPVGADDKDSDSKTAGLDYSFSYARI